jgi:serine/threonine-protein kinase
VSVNSGQTSGPAGGGDSPTDLSPVVLTDLLLLAVARRRLHALALVPEHSGYQVSIDSTVVGELPSTFGHAVVARLLFLAKLDLQSPGERLGRIRLQLSRTGQPSARGSGRVARPRIDCEVMILADDVDGRLRLELRPLVRVKPGPRTTPAPSATAAAAAAARTATAATAASPASPSAPAAGPGPMGTSALAAIPSTAGMGAYKIIGELARGGMGIIYRAEHTVLGRPVAIKVISPEFARDEALSARFVREARAAAGLRHPGIIDVTDFGMLQDGRPYLVMELVEAPTLLDVLRRGALLPPRALSIAAEVASVLEVVHAHGIVHRDIKPANIFVLAGDRIKLGDFGSCKLLAGAPGAGPGTLPHVFVGSPSYGAPEQSRGLPIDGRADLYALGCVLFEMLSGTRPYQANHPIELFSLHLNAPVPKVSSPHGLLPPDLQFFFQKALAKDREHRFASAADFRESLQDHLRTIRRPLG